MKALKLILALALTFVMPAEVYLLSGSAIAAWTVFAAMLVVQIPAGALAAAPGPDVSALTDSLGRFGGEIIQQMLNELDLGTDFRVYKNVKAPIPLPKISAVGEPRPYRTQDDFNEGAKLEDRILAAYQSKWDFQVDPEQLRNTYLADAGKDFDPNTLSFATYVIRAVGKKYLADINDKVVLQGVYNASGTGAVDLADGLAKYITAAITATDLTAVITGNTTSSNAIANVEKMAKAAPLWMRQAGFKVICSFATFDDYCANYKADHDYKFEPDATGNYRIDNFRGTIEPRSWMGTSDGLMVVPLNSDINKPLAFGTDGDSIRIFPTPHLNIINVRMTMPLGFQIADLEAIVVNDMFDEDLSS